MPASDPTAAQPANPGAAGLKLDCLAIGAHPDDAELLAGGTLALLAERGWRVGVLDLTRGESASRGTPDTRALEAQAAAQILGLACRKILDLGDGNLANSQANRTQVAETIRQLRPALILTHAAEDRHPDHRRAHQLVRDAAFFANVGGFDARGERHLIEAIACFPGNIFNGDPDADFVVDVSTTFARRNAALEAFATQFLADPADPNPTYIASREFWDHFERRLRTWGHRIGVSHGEPFLFDRPASTAHPLVRMVTTRP